RLAMLEVLCTIIAIVAYPDLQRRLTYQRFTMSNAALGFLLQSFQPTRQCGFCCRAHPVNEQNSVEMIVLMLDRPREKTARLDLKHLAFQGLRAHEHGLCPFNVAGDFGKT